MEESQVFQRRRETGASTQDTDQFGSNNVCFSCPPGTNSGPVHMTIKHPTGSNQMIVIIGFQSIYGISLRVCLNKAMSDTQTMVSGVVLLNQPFLKQLFNLQTYISPKVLPIPTFL